MKRWGKWYPYILLLLFGGALLYTIRRERGELPEEQARKLSGLLDFHADQVTRVRIVGEEGVLALEKQGDAWSVVEPLRARADDEEVKRLLEDWQDRATSRVIPGSEVDDWGRFGLKEPRHSLTVTEQDGTEATLQIGDKTSDNAYYARVKGQQALLKFPSFFIEDGLLRKKAGDVRDKTLVAFEAGDVERLILRHGEMELECARSDGRWELVRPRALPADQTEIETILTGLHDVKIDEFTSDNPSDLQPYGLDAPRGSIVLAVGAQGSHRLLIGKVKEDDTAAEAPATADEPGKVYVKREAEAGVYLVDRRVLDYASKGVDDLRRKVVWDLERDRVERISYSKAGQTVELKKRPPAGETAEEAWDLVQPRALPADGQRVDDLLYALVDLRALAFVDEPGDLAAYQLSPPRALVQVWWEGASDPGQLAFGKVAADGSGIYAWVDGSGPVYKVRASILDDLVTDINRLRDLLALEFDRKDVERLVLTGEGRTVEIRRRGESDWEVTEPEEFAADNFKVGDILYRVEELRGDSVVAESAGEPTQYGLDEPQGKAVIYFRRSAGRSPATVLIGKEDPESGKLYLQVEGNPMVYLKDRALLDSLTPEPDDLRPSPAPVGPGGF